MPLPPDLLSLPVAEALPDLVAALADPGIAVLEAPPGAGKTTAVPLALVEQPWAADGRIIMLEPRRLATRAAATRMAALLGEAPGGTIGYRMRGEQRVGASTRIEVVTDGLFTRLITARPELPGIAAVIFDEAHERALALDLGLTLALEARAALRPDLRLLVMSATLDAGRFARHLGNAPLIRAEGRMFPVEVFHRPRPEPRQLGGAMAAAIEEALQADSGDVLAFLPGAAEIRRTEQALGALPPAIDLHVLHGERAGAEQEAALRPASPGRRKIVLATPIAETSLTLPGITAVVDSGLRRRPVHDPVRGMTQLVTRRIAQAAAEQRRGRAGRVAPGRCWRLWPEAETRALLPHEPPEILEADLAPLALDLAAWGPGEAAALAWLDPPPAGPLAGARQLLGELGAIDTTGALTETGRQMVRLGLHPRLAAMLIGCSAGEKPTAALLAALLDDRDLGGDGADIGLRLQAAFGERPVADPARRARVRQEAARIARMAGTEPPRAPAFLSPPGPLLARAFPDRIAMPRADQPGTFRLSNGGAATLAPTDPLARAPFLAVAELEGTAGAARIRLAAPLARPELDRLTTDRQRREERVEWDPRAEAVVARQTLCLGALVLEERPFTQADPAAIDAALLDALRQRGAEALPWSPTARQLQARLLLLAQEAADLGAWPDLGDAALMATLADWLGPRLGGRRRLADLGTIDLAAALLDRLDPDQRRRLDRLAPPRIGLPSGNSAAIDYLSTGGPLIEVKLQEMFGSAETPRIVEGRVPLTLSLLSPASRPLQVTRDLAHFWRNGYAAVRAEMRGRYPRHPWPDDPLAAEPTAKAKPRR